MDGDWQDDSLDAKLAKLRADFGEDIEVGDCRSSSLARGRPS